MNIKKSCCVIFFLIILGGCGQSKSSSKFPPSNSGELELENVDGWTPRWDETNQDCRDRIQELVCVREGNQCVKPVPPRHLEALESVYDQFPRSYQNWFCHIEHFQIVDSEITASAGTRFIQVNMKRIERFPFLDDLLTFKEQMLFGYHGDSDNSDANLPKIVTGLDRNKHPYSSLFYVLAHEFGHLFSHSEDILAQGNCEWDQYCFEEGTWGHLHWKTKRVASDHEFEWYDELCFYDCEDRGYLDAGDANTVYSDLMESIFLTTYGSVNPREDQAEAFAAYVLHKQKSAYTKYVMSSGESFPTGAKLLDSSYEDQYKYLDDFFSKGKFVY